MSRLQRNSSASMNSRGETPARRSSSSIRWWSSTSPHGTTIRSAPRVRQHIPSDQNAGIQPSRTIAFAHDSLDTDGSSGLHSRCSEHAAPMPILVWPFPFFSAKSLLEVWDAIDSEIKRLQAQKATGSGVSTPAIDFSSTRPHAVQPATNCRQPPTTAARSVRSSTVPPLYLGSRSVPPMLVKLGYVYMTSLPMGKGRCLDIFTHSSSKTRKPMRS